MGRPQAGIHRWRFWRAGGVDQVRLDTGADLVHLESLDLKLWTALSCPVKGLEFDERTLSLLDTDGDGKVRAPEMIAVSRWLGTVLKDPSDLVQGVDGVPISNLDEASPEGKRLADAARHVLEALGKREAVRITVEDATKSAEIFANARWNGDGVVPPATIDDPAARRVATEIVECLGGAADRSGRPGVDGERLQAFFAAGEAYAAWLARGEADAASVMPLGSSTPEASAALDAVREKVDDFFLRGRLAAFDSRAGAAMNGPLGTLERLGAGDLAAHAADLRDLPLARVAPDAVLPLSGEVNPVWADAIARLREGVVAPLLGRDRAALSREDWRTLVERFSAHRAWAASKAGGSVERLGLARVREILASGARDALRKAIADDLAVAPQVEGIASVERLARCHRDFFRLANNFVSFTDFYARRRAIFQAGALYIDGRRCDLCVEVADAGKHAALAGMARTYLVYLECTRPSARMTVVAGMTAGDSDNLFVGRNGLFYDRAGRDWGATITRIVENPISVAQAFWAPYKRIVRWIEERVAKRAAAADDAANARLQSLATPVVAPAAAPDAAAARPKFDIGTLAAIGLAVGAITAALGAMLQALFGLGIWMPLGLVGLVLLVSGPSMLVAGLKLRRRNLGPILDANGWAVNALTRINVPLGRSLTESASLPEGAERSHVDPYGVKRRVWPWVLVVLLGLAGIAWVLWRLGYLFPTVPAPESPSSPGR